MSKLRNRANLIITIGVAPVLALLIATILPFYSDQRTVPFLVGLSSRPSSSSVLIVATVNGLTNSADDIVIDRAVLQRH